MSGCCWALLPVKDVANAKQRLDSVLTAVQREQLSLALLSDLLDEIARCRGLAGVLVVCGDPGLAERVPPHAAHFVLEPESVRGLSAAVSWGLGWLQQRGASRALVLHGDLPLATAAALDAVLDAGGAVTLVPDWRGDGTNAMVLPLPAPIAMAYGPGSFERHRAQALAAGQETRVVTVSTLAFDVDTPHDLAMLQALAASGHGGVRTRAALAGLGISPELAVGEAARLTLARRLGLE